MSLYYEIRFAFEKDGPERLRSTLQALTPRTITKFSALEKELDEIRRRDFAETIDELEEGFSGVGALFRGGMGEILGAFSICGPSQRMTESRRAQLGATLCSVATHLQPRY